MSLPFINNIHTLGGAVSSLGLKIQPEKSVMGAFFPHQKSEYKYLLPEEVHFPGFWLSHQKFGCCYVFAS